mmetsp:Transcript_1758/g.7082  ORF Transcript_1758/g.7082 Transcript_1758/m.7082 type:complete len:651 (-) Transcript_1758:388-2340(-)
MSEHVGDRKGSAPFKEGTIKYACYEVLKHAGPRGLTVAEIVRHIRDGALAKLGGATPANTIVGQLSKDANFSLVCKATYALRTDAAAPESFVSERTGFQSASRKRKYPSDSEVSGCSAARLFYRPGSAVEVLGKRAYDPKVGRGGDWRSAAVVAVEGENVTVQFEAENDESAPGALRETFGKHELAKRVRPRPPAELLPVEGRVANEEVDVLINRVWREGLVVDASAASHLGDGQRRITVCVPNADGAPNAKVVVFQDSSERVWARDAFQKRGAKTSGLRRGWAFSGTAGQWLCRGHAAVVTSERREEDGVAGRFAGRDLPDFQLTKLEKPKLEAESACASPRRPSRESERVAPAKLDLSAFSIPELSGAAAAAYGHGESSPERGARATFNASSVSASPPFKSLSDACRHLLLDAGPAGLQVSTLVHEIQKRKLVKLGGRTPSNTVYSRLSQDARFVNVARGAYALADVVGAAANTSAPPRFDGAAANARRDAGGSPSPHAFPDDGDTGSVRGDGDGDGDALARARDDTRRLLSDESLEEVVGKSSRRVSGRRREAHGTGDDAATARPTDPSLRSQRVSAETLADSSAFSVETKFGKDAKSAFDASAAVSVAAAARAAGDDDEDVELSAELSAGVLMGLRSGKRHVSACR